MSLKEAVHILLNDASPINSQVLSDRVREFGIRSRYLEHQIKVGHNAGIWNMAGARVLEGDIGVAELEGFAGGFNEPVFMLSEEEDRQMGVRQGRHQPVLLADIMERAAVVIIPRNFTHPTILSPGLYVSTKTDSSIHEALKDPTMQLVDMPVERIRQGRLSRSILAYRDRVLGGSRVERALSALGID